MVLDIGRPNPAPHLDEGTVLGLVEFDESYGRPVVVLVLVGVEGDGEAFGGDVLHRAHVVGIRFVLRSCKLIDEYA